MSLLEKLYATPLGKQVAARAGLAEPPTLRRGRVLPIGPVVLAELSGGGIGAEALALAGVHPVAPVLDVPEARTKDDRGATCRRGTTSGPGRS